jgi:hypothetical protein
LSFRKHSPPPFEKGGLGGFRTGNGAKNPPSPPFSKGGTERLRHFVAVLTELDPNALTQEQALVELKRLKTLSGS